MTGEEVLTMTRQIRLRDPRRHPNAGDQVRNNQDGWTRIVSQFGGDYVIYRKRLGLGPIGTARRGTMASWRSWAAYGSVLHHAGVKAA